MKKDKGPKPDQYWRAYWVTPNGTHTSGTFVADSEEEVRGNIEDRRGTDIEIKKMGT